jgi:hypothetical protein
LRCFAAASRVDLAALAVLVEGPVLRAAALRAAEPRGVEARRGAFVLGRRDEDAARGVEAAFRGRRAGARFAMMTSRMNLLGLGSRDYR